MYDNILLVFAIQIICEFLPVSSSLLLTTLGMEEGLLFHIFSGIISAIIYFQHIWEILKFPLKNKHTIQVYCGAILPSVIVGFLTIAYPFLVIESLRLSLISNVIAGGILFLATFFRKNDKEVFAEHTKNKEANHFTVMDGFFLGIVISLSGFIPGLSRLGSGLTYAMLRKKNIIYSNQVLFVTGIPIFFGQQIIHMIQHPGARHLFINFILTQHIYAALIGLVVILLFDKVKALYSSRVLLCVSACRIMYYSYYLLFCMA